MVTIENVPRYRDSESMKIIEEELKRQGYVYDANVYDAADFGVPQTRRRFIVRAVRPELLKGAER